MSDDIQAAADAARTARNEALAKGDHDGAARHDAAERQALARMGPVADAAPTRVDVPNTDSTPATSESGLPAEHVEHVFNQLTDEFGPQDADALRLRWGPLAGEKLAIVQALAQDHRDLIEVTERWGLADHPAILELAALVAEKSGYRVNGRRETRKVSPMTNASVPETAEARVEAEASELRRLRNEAQARGDHRDAQRYDEAERRLYARIDNRPIVGAHGRTA